MLSPSCARKNSRNPCEITSLRLHSTLCLSIIKLVEITEFCWRDGVCIRRDKNCLSPYRVSTGNITRKVATSYLISSSACFKHQFMSTSVMAYDAKLHPAAIILAFSSPISNSFSRRLLQFRRTIMYYSTPPPPNFFSWLDSP
jgi:hypothetical protein